MQHMDFWNDPTRLGLTKVAEMTDTPDWVKQAEVASPDEISMVQDESFAWPQKRLFPCHTKEATYMSAVYFLTKEAHEQQQIPRYVRDRLFGAAYKWEIEEDVLRAASQVVEHTKRANTTSDDDYGLVIREGNRTKRLYPLFSGGHVKAAGEYFSKNYSKYPLPWRVQLATRIMRKSAQYLGDAGSGLPAAVQVYAGHCVCDSVKLASFLADRATVAADRSVDVARQFLSMARSVRGHMTHPSALAKTAEAIGCLDRRCGLEELYDRMIPDPMVAVFNLPVKVAEDILSVIKIGNNQYTTAELVEAGPDVFAEALGSDFVDSVSTGGLLDPHKMRVVIPTLPRPDLSMLAMNLEEALGRGSSDPVVIGSKGGGAAFVPSVEGVPPGPGLS